MRDVGGAASSRGTSKHSIEASHALRTPLRLGRLAGWLAGDCREDAPSWAAPAQGPDGGLLSWAPLRVRGAEASCRARPQHADLTTIRTLAASAATASPPSSPQRLGRSLYTSRCRSASPPAAAALDPASGCPRPSHPLAATAMGTAGAEGGAPRGLRGDPPAMAAGAYVIPRDDESAADGSKSRPVARRASIAWSGLAGIVSPGSQSSAGTSPSLPSARQVTCSGASACTTAFVTSSLASASASPRSPDRRTPTRVAALCWTPSG